MTPPMHLTTMPTHALLMALANDGQLTGAALSWQLQQWGYPQATPYYVAGLLQPMLRGGKVVATGTHRKRVYMLGAMAPAWAWQLMQIGGKRDEQ